MTPEETAENYDQLAHYWNGSELDRANGIEQHCRALKFLKNKKCALDVGCGSSGRIIDYLLGAGFDVEGIDISAEMIRLAKERHPKVDFHQADICEWDLSKSYDFISAWDSIWHIPLSEQESIIRRLCSALKSDGVLIFTTGGVDEPGECSNPFLGVPLYHATLGIPKLLEILLSCDCVCRHLEYDQYPEEHLYLIAQRV